MSAHEESDDLAALMDYLDGRLSEEDMMDLELRLSQEPELAAKFESLETFDHVRRAVALAERGAGGGR